MVPKSFSASDDIMAQVMEDYIAINAIHYGEVVFTIQDGRMVATRYVKTQRVGKEIQRPCEGS
jgi:hypothetical protein